MGKLHFTLDNNPRRQLPGSASKRKGQLRQTAKPKDVPAAAPSAAPARVAPARPTSLPPGAVILWDDVEGSDPPS